MLELNKTIIESVELENIGHFTRLTQITSVSSKNETTKEFLIELTPMNEDGSFDNKFWFCAGATEESNFKTISQAFKFLSLLENNDLGLEIDDLILEAKRS